MNVRDTILNDIVHKINTNNKVKFKLYSLDYVIERENGKFIIYPVLYKRRTNETYDSLEDVLTKYMVYKESILDNISKITNIE